MALDTLIIFAGTIVAILPFLGLPNRWDTIIFFILGTLIVGLGIIVRRRMSHHTKGGGSTTFVESQPNQVDGLRHADEHEAA